MNTTSVPCENIWRGILSKSFFISSEVFKPVSEEIERGTDLFEEDYPKPHEMVEKEEKILFPSRLVSGFLWPDMTKSEIWALLNTNNMFRAVSFPREMKKGSLMIENFPTRLNFLKSLDQSLLRQMKISLPANITPSSLNQKGPDFHSPSFFLNYKKGQLPVLRYVTALLADFDLDADFSTVQDLKKRLNAKTKLDISSKWFFVNWVKRAFGFLTFWQKRQKVAFYGQLLNRFEKHPQTFLSGKNSLQAKEWLKRMKGLLANQQDSFFGEEKILMPETPMERRELEFPTDFLLELDGEIVPFGGFNENHFQTKFEGIESIYDIDDNFNDQECIESSSPLLSIYQRRVIPELNPYEWYHFLQSQLELYFTDPEDFQLNSEEKISNSAETDKTLNQVEQEEKENQSLFSKFKLRLPSIVVEKAKSSEISAPLTLFNSQPFAMEVFPFISVSLPRFSYSPSFPLFELPAVPFPAQLEQLEKEKPGNAFFNEVQTGVTPFASLPDARWNSKSGIPKGIHRHFFTSSLKSFHLAPLEYRFNFQPWSGYSLAELNNTLPLISGDYRKKSTSFQLSKRNIHRSTQNLSESFEQKWEPLTTSSWRIFYKLVYIFWIQESLQTLYKGYGKEILQSLVSILVALGFDVNQVLDFLNLKETESGLRIIEKSKRKFDDIAGVDSLLPELGETIWFLKTKGNLPTFQIPSPPLTPEGVRPFPTPLITPIRCKACEPPASLVDLKSLGKPPLPFIPKGTLLVGPPGTGKTFLVQALAGEAGVPVVLQSASALMKLDSNPSEALSKLFQKARNLSPCILFIDEVDTLGSSRENVLSGSLLQGEFALEPSLELFSPRALGNSAGGNEAMGSQIGLQGNKNLNPKSFSAESQFSHSFSEETEEKKPYRQPSGTPHEVLQDYQKKVSTSKQKLAILMQFIVEMDGLKKLSGVALMGATNRPGVLDPALVRPGRFEKTLTLELPNKEKRIAILQHYASKIGLEKSLQWDALGEMTTGFTAADISSAMNQSALYVLLNPFVSFGHTLDTVEAGIESIRRERKESPMVFSKVRESLFLKNQDGEKRMSSKPSLLNELDQEIETMWNSLIILSNNSFPCTKTIAAKDRQSITSIAYNESGKAVFHEIGNYQDNMSFLSILHPEKERIHSSQNSFSRRFEIESDIVKFNAGKGSEAFFLGTRETQTRENFYFFCKNLFPDSSPNSSFSKGIKASDEAKVKTLGRIEKTSQPFTKEIFGSTNASQDLSQVPIISEVAIQDDLLYSEDISRKNLFFLAGKRDQSEIKDPLLRASLRFLSSKDKEHIKRETLRDYFSIQSYPGPKRYSDLGDLPFGNWYRMFLSDPEQGERNEEWVESDKIYSTIETLENVSSLLKSRSRFTNRNVSFNLSDSDQQEKEKPEPKEKLSIPPNLQTPSLAPHPKGVTNSVETGLTTKGVRTPLSSSAEERLAKEKNFFGVQRRIGLVTQKDIQPLIRDYIFQGLATNAFNESHKIFSKNREILDLTVNFSLRYQKIRSYEMKPVLKRFSPQSPFSFSLSSAENKLSDFSLKPIKKGEQATEDSQVTKTSVSLSWGSFSQKPSPRLIRLDKIEMGSF
eukprot:jgi/Botrbrau1/11427/Bobra.0151s0054.1